MSDDDYRPTYTALPCPCGHRACKNWFVAPVAAYQGVSFTEAQAKAVAKFLTNFDATERKEQHMKKLKVRIYSIFGQIEASVADTMLEEPDSKIKKISFNSIPAKYQYNKKGIKAHCALMMNRDEAKDFDERVAALRS